MKLDRRYFLGLAGLTAAPSAAAPGQAPQLAPMSAAAGVDARQFGLRPGSADDQSHLLQRAVDEAARVRTPLSIPPGIYRVGDVKLSSGAQLFGARGASTP
jgi:uncharacterized secreted repeat protein (TIGR03808 family)